MVAEGSQEWGCGTGLLLSTRSCAGRDRETSACNSLSLWCCCQNPSQAGEHTCQGDKQPLLSHLYSHFSRQMDCQSPVLLWCRTCRPTSLHPHSSLRESQAWRVAPAAARTPQGLGAPQARVEKQGHSSWGHSPAQGSLCFSACNHPRKNILVS